MLFCSLPWHMTCALPGRAFTPFFSLHCSFGHQGGISFMMPSLTSLHMSSEFLAWFWIYAESLNTSVIAMILYYNGMFTSRPFLFIWAPLRQSCHLKYVSLVPSVQYLLNEKILCSRNSWPLYPIYFSILFYPQLRQNCSLALGARIQ